MLFHDKAIGLYWLFILALDALPNSYYEVLLLRSYTNVHTAKLLLAIMKLSVVPHH